MEYTYIRKKVFIKSCVVYSLLLCLVCFLACASLLAFGSACLSCFGCLPLLYPLLCFCSALYIAFCFALCAVLPSCIACGSLHWSLFVGFRVCLLQNYSVALCFLSSLKKLLLVGNFFGILSSINFVILSSKKYS